MVVVGADGYPGGWVLYSINVQSFATQVEVTPDLASLLRSRPADMAALGIDVPIGLLDRPRACDLAARKLLGVRGCCVFPAPSRAAVRGALSAGERSESGTNRPPLFPQPMARLWISFCPHAIELPQSNSR